jgi:hypothetical protein
MTMHNGMRPQDVAVLLRIVLFKDQRWMNKDLARLLYLSPAEITGSIERSILAGLIDSDRKTVFKQSLLEFLQYGIKYVFPAIRGGVERGVLTAHSHPAIQARFASEQFMVWPDATGKEKGFSISPLYPSAAEAAKNDPEMHFLLSLVDLLRVGKTRERSWAINQLEKAFHEPSHQPHAHQGRK